MKGLSGKTVTVTGGGAALAAPCVSALPRKAALWRYWTVMKARPRPRQT